MFRTSAVLVAMALTGCGVGSDLNGNDTEFNRDSIVSGATLSKVLEKSPSYFKGPGSLEYVQDGQTQRKSGEMQFSFEKQKDGSYLVNGVHGGECAITWNVSPTLPGLKIQDNAGCSYDVSEGGNGCEKDEGTIAHYQVRYTKGALVVLSATTARLEIESNTFRNGKLLNTLRSTVNGTWWDPPSSPPSTKK